MVINLDLTETLFRCSFISDKQVRNYSTDFCVKYGLLQLQHLVNFANIYTLHFTLHGVYSSIADYII